VEKINQNKKDKALYFTYLPRRSLAVDWHKFWATCSSRGLFMDDFISINVLATNMKMGFLNRVNIFHPPMTSGDVTMTYVTSY